MASRIARVNLANLKPAPGSQHLVRLLLLLNSYSELTAHNFFRKSVLGVAKDQAMEELPDEVLMVKNHVPGQVYGLGSKEDRHPSQNCSRSVALSISKPYLLDQVGWVAKCLMKQ